MPSRRARGSAKLRFSDDEFAITAGNERVHRVRHCLMHLP